MVARVEVRFVEAIGNQTSPRFGANPLLQNVLLTYVVKISVNIVLQFNFQHGVNRLLFWWENTQTNHFLRKEVREFSEPMCGWDGGSPCSPKKALIKKEV
jgi:hypothetical protein